MKNTTCNQQPKLVRTAMAAGLDVKQQGNWCFVPVTVATLPHGLHDLTVVSNGAWLDEHWAPRAITIGGEAFVRGLIVHPDYFDLRLDGWHRAVRE